MGEQGEKTKPLKVRKAQEDLAVAPMLQNTDQGAP